MKILLMGPPTTNGFRSFGKSQDIYGGGWVENLVDALAAESNIELYVCFYANFTAKLQISKYLNVTYIALPTRVKGLTHCNQEMRYDLKQALELCRPDVVHIIGTEREHDFYLLQLAGAEKTLLSATGLVSVYARHYYGGIDKSQFYLCSLGDFVRRSGPIREQKRFIKYGKYEQQLLRQAQYVTGRTTWDLACVKQINPDVQYTFCGEILNPIYFKYQWNAQGMHRHTIFVSQGGYAIKGLHMLIEALPIVLKKYPDCKIEIAGANILKKGRFMDRIKRTTYANYLSRQIKKLHIPSGAIQYTGPLNAKEMCDRYLHANVFVLPSAIENSPNSLGEAMVLGVPCIASCVGGVQDMIDDRNDGFIYPFDEPYMLAHYICEIFADDALAEKIGRNAAASAKKRFDASAVRTTVLDLYKKIANGSNESEKES